MRLFHRIFLLVSLTALTAALAMAGLTAFNLSRGFDAYLDDRDEQRLEEFVAEAEAMIEMSGSDDIRAASALVPEDLLPRPRRRPPPQDQNAQDQGSQNRGSGGGENQGPNRIGRPPLPPPGFLPRISLYDEAGNRIAGPPARQNGIHAMRMPISANGKTIGEAVLLPRGPTPDGIETEFLNDQFRTLGLLALVLIALSGIAAFFLARKGGRIIDQMSHATSAIAAGDFSSRVDQRGGGEIGELAENINRMASNLATFQQARQTWLAEIGHELRTPITVLQGELEAIDAGIRPLNGDAIRSLSEETERLSLLIEDLQFLAISDLATPTYSFAPCDLAQIIEATQRRFEPRCASANLDLSFPKLTQGSAALNWDVARIEQLLANLIENAIAYTSAPGTIRVNAKAHDDHVIIAVEDTPPGVEDHELAELFDPLFRGEKSRDRASGGSGLGLAVSAAIAHHHGGTIAADHSQLGGLKIELRLPKDAQTAQDTAS
ncbi:MAG: ATP-binding protein [Erythrobacter sp.]